MHRTNAANEKMLTDNTKKSMFLEVVLTNITDGRGEEEENIQSRKSTNGGN